MLHLAAGSIEDTGCADVFIGNVQSSAIGAHSKLFRIGSGRELFYEFFLFKINHTDAVSRVVGIFVIIIVILGFGLDRISLSIEGRRSRNWTAAQGDIKY